MNGQGRVVYIDEYDGGGESGSRGERNRMMLWGVGVTGSERRDGVRGKGEGATQRGIRGEKEKTSQ